MKHTLLKLIQPPRLTPLTLVLLWSAFFCGLALNAHPNINQTALCLLLLLLGTSFLLSASWACPASTKSAWRTGLDGLVHWVVMSVVVFSVFGGFIAVIHLPHHPLMKLLLALVGSVGVVLLLAPSPQPCTACNALQNTTRKPH